LWSDGSVWDTTATRYSGTLADNRFTWNAGPPWDVVGLFGGTARQTLTVAATYPGQARYSRTQEGTPVPETYLADGYTLTESSGDVGTFDPATGLLTWVTQPTWTKVGTVPRLTGQEFTMNTASGKSVLYLHGQGAMAGLNSRGPGRASTALAKIPMDSRAPINHVSIQRPHRWVLQCPGSLSHLVFTLQDVYGNMHRLSEYGQHISFVLTWASRD